MCAEHCLDAERAMAPDVVGWVPDYRNGTEQHRLACEDAGLIVCVYVCMCVARACCRDDQSVVCSSLSRWRPPAAASGPAVLALIDAFECWCWHGLTTCGLSRSAQ